MKDRLVSLIQNKAAVFRRLFLLPAGSDGGSNPVEFSPPRIFRRRPFATAATLFLSSAFAAFYLSRSTKLFVMVTLAALAVIILFSLALVARPYVRRRLPAAFLLSFLCLSAASGFLSTYLWFDAAHGEVKSRFDGDAYIIGKVTDYSYKSSFLAYYEVELITIDGVDTNAKIKLESTVPDIAVGEIFGMKAHISDFREESGGYPERAICLSKGFTARAEQSGECELFGIAPRGIGDFFSSLRASLSYRLRRSVNGDTAAMQAALLLGERDGLRGTTALRDFSRCGLSHMLALSGMHLSVLVGGLEFLLRRFRVGRAFRVPILALCLIFYVALTGFSVSVCRSALMLACAYAAFFLGRQRDSLTSLFFAAVVIIIFAPYCIISVSLWLSFFATLGILLLNEIFASRRGRLFSGGGIVSRLASALLFRVLLTVSALVFTLPLSYFVFGSVSALSVPANLICAPVVEALLILALPLSLFGGITPLVFVSEKLTALLLHITSELSAVRGASLSLNYPFMPYFIAAVCVAVSALAVLNIKNFRVCIITPLMLATALVIIPNLYLAAHEKSLCMLSVTAGRRDATVLFEDGAAIICDFSDGSKTFITKAINSAADAFPVTETEAYILTHYHSAFARSLSLLCREYVIRNLFLPAPADGEDEYIARRLCNIAAQYGVETAFYEYGDRIEFGGAVIIFGEPETLERSQVPVFFASVEKGGKRAVFIGSAASELDSDRAALASADADAIILGAHGPLYKREIEFAENRRARLIIAPPAALPFISEEDKTAFVERKIALIASEGVYKFEIK